MADAVAKISSLLQQSPLEIVTSPSAVPVAPISIDYVIVSSPPVVADLVTTPTAVDIHDTDIFYWYQ